MNPWAQMFKGLFVVAADKDGVSITRSGLRDFLLDDPPDDLPQFATKALMHFCIEDGKFNGNVTALKAVFAFLEEARDGFGKQARADLVQIVLSYPVQEASLLHWAQSWLA